MRLLRIPLNAVGRPGSPRRDALTWRKRDALVEPSGFGADWELMAVADETPGPGRPRVDNELRTVLARVFALTPADQLRLYDTLRDYLAAAEPAPDGDRKLSAQVVGLSALERVQAHLELEPQVAPTRSQFDAAANELGIDLTARRIARVFGTFRIAQLHLIGERPGPSAGQEAKRRAAVGRPRSHEDYQAAIRIWLAATPESLTVKDYDAFTCEYNATQSEGSWLPSASAVKKGLTLSWKEVLRVARREVAFEEAVQKQLASRETRTRGPHDLIGVREIGQIFDLTMTSAWELTRTAGFPPPALILGNKRGWLRDDVDAYRVGQRRWSRQPNWLRNEYLDMFQVAARIGVRPTSIASRHSSTAQPDPTGMVAGRRYWLKVAIDEWVLDHPELIAARLRARNGASSSPADI